MQENTTAEKNNIVKLSVNDRKKGNEIIKQSQFHVINKHRR